MIERGYKHCLRCAGLLRRRECEGHDRLLCDDCGFIFYENPAPASGVVVIEDGQVLWVKRKFEPRAGLWTLPAGFVEYDEHVQDCAVRETREETGLEVELLRLFGAYMAMDDPRTHVVLLLYLARRTGGTLRAGDDAAEVSFFPSDAPPPVAFAAHTKASDDIRALLGR